MKKNIIIISLTALLLISFTRNVKQKQYEIPNTWTQYLGKDSVEYLYKFKDVNGCKLLDYIRIREKNPGDGGEHIFSQQLLFDSIGKVKKVFCLRSVKIHFEKDENQSYYAYDEDRILFKRDRIDDISVANNFELVLSIARSNNLLCDYSGKLVYPIYDFSRDREKVKFRPIGRGVDILLDTANFNKKLISNLYKTKKQKGTK